MPLQFDNSNAVTSWNHDQEFSTMKSKHDLISCQQLQVPSSLISKLSTIFINTVNYYNLSKQDALDAIAYILYEHDDIVHSQLFDSFINHDLLICDDTTKRYTVNYHHFNNTGIFIPLTKCYSPSCQLDDIKCYSPLCPNKPISNILHTALHQEHQSMVTQPLEQCHFSIKERNSLHQENNNAQDWITSIPNHLRNTTNRKELKRQAGISELLLTENNYCQDLDILHQIYAIPLLESTEVICNLSRRQQFYKTVFGNYLDITHLHHSFHKQLTCHNRESGFFIGRVGTIIMQHVTNLIEPYIQYASNHTKAIYCMTIEHKNNSHFANFLSTQNTLICTRRLGFRHYLTSPTLWIGKFKLMVEAILKNTTDDADQLSLRASLAILHDTLCRMNNGANLNSQDFRFEELSASIYTLSGAELQLLVIPDGSTLIKEEALWLARSTHPLQPSLCHIFLFSHAMILTHPRIFNGRTEYIVIAGSPIPIQLLVIDNKNTNSSMIRRLSFASTSMVSTPIYLINNLRRQKSMNLETSSYSDTSNSGNTSTRSNGGNRLFRSNTTINTVSPKPAQRSPTAISADRKNRVLSPFQIKSKLSQLKNNFRWSTSFSLPVSPSVVQTESTEASVSRRESAPALLLSYKNHKKQTENEPTVKKTQQQRRTLNISHMAFPENIFKLEFLSRSDRVVWENAMREVVMNIDKSKNCFKVKLFLKDAVMSPIATTITTTNSGNGMNNFKKIRCAYTFAYNVSSSNNRSSAMNMVALSTQSGVWIGPRDGSTPFRLALANQDVYQLSILHDKLIVLTHNNKKHSLIAYSLDSIIYSNELQHMDWCMVKRSSVICFTVGKIRNQSVIVYLTKRLQAIWLVIIVPKLNGTNNQRYNKNNWFKKYKTEYKVTIKDPLEIQVLHDSVFIRSDRNGIERIAISSISSTDAVNLFSGPNIGLLVSTKDGFVCDSQYAYSVSLVDQYQINNRALMSIKFESQANAVAIVFPYLIVFSTSVIEIRNIETTELVQAIRGNQIEFISVSNDSTQPLIFTMMNEDKTTSAMYQLQLTL